MQRACLMSLAVLVLSDCSPNASCPLGRTRTVPVSVFTSEGVATPVTMTFPAPTGCALPEGTLQATGTWSSSGEAPQPLVVDTLEHDDRRGQVTVRFSFTPRAAGFGELKLFVDPQLGIAQVPVFVARDGTKLPFVDTTPACTEPQRTRSGVLVCADPGGDAGTTLWRDGVQVGDLPGAAFPQVVGDVLWAQRFTDGGFAIERFVVSPDGGLSLTHTGWRAGPRIVTPRYADEGRALRLALIAIPLADGGLDLPEGSQGSTAAAHVAEPTLAWARTNDRWCTADGGCLPVNASSKVAGIGLTVWWEAASSTLVVHPRPIADAGSIATVPLPSARAVTLRSNVQGVRRPRLPDNDGLFFFDWRPDAGGLVLTFFPEWGVREENADFVSFALDGGVVRFVSMGP